MMCDSAGRRITMPRMACTITVRLDDETEQKFDALVAYYGRQAEAIGLTADRSSTVRAIIRSAHRDLNDKVLDEF